MKYHVIDLVQSYLDVYCFYLMLIKVSCLAELLMKSYRENESKSLGIIQAVVCSKEQWGNI